MTRRSVHRLPLRVLTLLALVLLVVAGCEGDGARVDPPHHLRAIQRSPGEAHSRMLASAGTIRLRLVWDPSETIAGDRGGRYLVLRVSGQRLDVRDEVASVPGNVTAVSLSLSPPLGEHPPFYEVVAETADDRRSRRWGSGLIAPRPFLSGLALSIGTAPHDGTPCLPTTPVSLLQPDGRGGLWIGTDGAGVAWLASPGADWRRWSSLDGLLDDRPRSLAVDREGRAWIATRKGLQRLDPRTGAWRTLTEADGLPAQPIDAVVIDVQGILRLLADGALWCVAPSDRRPFRLGSTDEETLAYALRARGLQTLVWQEEYRSLALLLGSGGDRPVSLRRAPDGALWIRTAAGALLRRAPNRITWKAIGGPAATPLFGEATIETVAPAAGESAWALVDRGVMRRRPDGTWSRFALSGGGARVDAIAIDDAGSALVLIGGQTLRCTDEAPRLCVPVGPAPSATRPAWSRVARNPGGAMWLVSRDGRAERWTVGGVTALPPLPSCATAPPPAGLTALTLDPHGTLWVASREGIVSRAPATRRWTAEPLGERLGSGPVAVLTTDPRGDLFAANQDGVAVRVARPLLRSSLLGPSAAPPTSVALGLDRRVWVGGPDGLRWYDLSTGEWQRVISSDGSPVPPVYALASSTAGRIWIASKGGLLRWSSTDAAVRSATAPLAGAKPVTALLLDRFESLWAATPSAVWHLPPLASKAVAHPLPAGWRHDPVTHLAALASDTVVVVTRGGRVGCARDDAPSVRGMLELFPSISADVRGLAVDERGTAWLATRARGLVAIPSPCP